jgi:hypothetical protein
MKVLAGIQPHKTLLPALLQLENSIDLERWFALHESLPRTIALCMM